MNLIQLCIATIILFAALSFTGVVFNNVAANIINKEDGTLKDGWATIITICLWTAFFFVSNFQL